MTVKNTNKCKCSCKLVEVSKKTFASVPLRHANCLQRASPHSVSPLVRPSQAFIHDHYSEESTILGKQSARNNFTCHVSTLACKLLEFGFYHPHEQVVKLVDPVVRKMKDQVPNNACPCYDVHFLQALFLLLVTGESQPRKTIFVKTTEQNPKIQGNSNVALIKRKTLRHLKAYPSTL